MGGPSSPRQKNDGEGSGGRSPAPATEKERPRSFDEKTRTACWRKAAVLAGRHPERWRQDAVGNVVCRRFWGCHGCLCYEYDHIVPFSRGGESTLENCQILQTRVNRSKSDKAWVEQAEMRGFSCDIKFTDQELDIIEMAVYGDVIRPGKQCRCRTVAEMLGQVKSMNRMAACELPDKGVPEGVTLLEFEPVGLEPQGEQQATPEQEVQAGEGSHPEDLPECPDNHPSSFLKDDMVYHGYCKTCLHPAVDED